MNIASKVRLIAVVMLSLIAISIWIFADELQGTIYARSNDQSRWVAGIPGRTAVLCVSNLDGTKVPYDVLQRVHKAFTTNVKTHRYFQQAGLDVNPPIPPDEVGTREKGIDLLIRNSCPAQSTIKTKKWGNNRVKGPGSVHTYVFIASAEELSQTAFKRYPRVVGQEYVCEAAQCNSVANALYITPEELNNPDELAKALTAGVGLAWEEVTQPGYVNGVTPDDKSK